MLKGEQIIRVLPFIAFMDVRDIAISVRENVPCLYCPILKECNNAGQSCEDFIENYILSGDLDDEEEEE